MKNTAFQEFKRLIKGNTEKSKEDISNAIKNAKQAALKDIQDEYDAILTDLHQYNKSKEDINKETKMTISSMQKAKVMGKEIQEEMNTVVVEN